MTVEIIEPIIVDENGAAEVYANLKDACSDLEAVDVSNGVYKAFDARGLVLDVRADGSHVRITAPDHARYDHEYLLKQVRRLAQAIGPNRLGGLHIDDASLDLLLTRILLLN